MKGPARGASVVHIEVTPRSILFVLAAVVGVWLAYKLWLAALILVMALILAGTFNPVIEWMEARGIKRIYAMLLLFVTLLVVAAALVFLTLPPLLEQLTQMVQEAPITRTRLLVLLNDHDVTRPFAHLLQNMRLPEGFARLETYLLGYSTRAIQVVGLGVTTLV